MTSDMARIHYEIPDDLHRLVRIKAATEGKSIKQVVVEALEAATADTEPRKPKK